MIDAMRPADLDAHARGKLAERLVAPALDLAGLVHGDGDAAEIASFIAAVPAAEKDALLIVLAAMVPMDQTAEQLLSHVTWDEYGRPLPEGPVSEEPAPVRKYGTVTQPEIRKQAKCGSYQGYRQHLYQGDARCDPCWEAKNAYMRDWKAKKRQREKEVA